jgi:hypothetical protein
MGGVKATEGPGPGMYGPFLGARDRRNGTVLQREGGRIVKVQRSLGTASLKGGTEASLATEQVLVPDAS